MFNKINQLVHHIGAYLVFFMYTCGKSPMLWILQLHILYAHFMYQDTKTSMQNIMSIAHIKKTTCNYALEINLKLGSITSTFTHFVHCMFRPNHILVSIDSGFVNQKMIKIKANFTCITHMHIKSDLNILKFEVVKINKRMAQHLSNRRGLTTSLVSYQINERRYILVHHIL